MDITVYKQAHMASEFKTALATAAADMQRELVNDNDWIKKLNIFSL